MTQWSEGAPSNAVLDGATGQLARFDEVCEAVQACLAELLDADPGDMGPDTVPLDFGADSMCLTRLAFQLEQRFGVRLPTEYTIPDVFTIGALARVIASRLGPATR